MGHESTGATVGAGFEPGRLARLVAEAAPEPATAAPPQPVTPSESSVLAEIASVSDPTGAYVRGRLAAARSYRAALLRDREVMLRVLGDAILTAEAEIRLWEGRLSVAEGVPGDRFTDWPVSEGEVPALTTAPPDPLPIPYPAR